MISVLHIITGLKIGGAENALYRLVTNFEKENYTHRVISLTSGGTLLKQFEEAKVEVTQFDFKKNPLKQFWKLSIYIKSLKPDIVNTWMYHANIIGGIAARFAGIKKIIWGLRTTDANKGSKIFTKVIRRIGGFLSYPIPKIIICVADAAKQSHIKIGYSAKKMIIINNGFDIYDLKFREKSRQNFRTELGYKPNHVVVGSVGRFNKAKDHRNFIKAAGIAAKKNSNIRFLIIGKGISKKNKELFDWIKTENIQKKINLMEERTDISICLSSMDVFCLHSSREGFPNALAEAMLVGLPCVSTNVGDVDLLLNDIGIVVKKEDSFSLAQGILKLVLLDHKEKEAIASRSRKRICDNFSIKEICNQYESAYSSVLNGS
tara:strand:+ start:487 stop:1614 length:1128 start_codon:yes stop_codon:yes gene_type:complete